MICTVCPHTTRGTNSAGKRNLSRQDFPRPTPKVNTPVGFAVDTLTKKIISGAMEDVDMSLAALAGKRADDGLVWNAWEASGFAQTVQRNIGLRVPVLPLLRNLRLTSAATV